MTGTLIAAACLAFLSGAGGAPEDLDVLAIQVTIYRVRGDISGESSLTEDIFIGKEARSLEAKKGPCVFFTAPNLTIAGVKLQGGKDGWTWDGKDQPPEGSRIQILIRPRVNVRIPQSFKIFIGSTEPIQYFEKVPDGHYDLRTFPGDAGISVSASVEKAGPGQIVLKDFLLRFQTVEKRMPLDGVHLDVGSPLVSAEELMLSIRVRPDQDYGIIYTSKAEGCLLLRLRVTRAPPEAAASVEKPAPRGKIPVVYSTDLYHPHVDADDHFDMATLLALEELDLLGVVLDNAGPSQEERPGAVPLDQLEAIAGRKIPRAMGLRKPLAGPEDKALDDDRRFQGGVEMILRALRESPVPPAIVAVGSLRDVAAAFNREPDLFRQKNPRLLIFIADAAEEFSNREYNVELDRGAFVRILGSGLDVWWVPCFDGGHPKNLGHGSFWLAERKALLAGAAPEVQQYFIYCLKKPGGDPLAFVKSPPGPEDVQWLLSGSKELFCTAIFTCLTSRKTYFDGTRWLALPPEKASGLEERKVFGFSPVDLVVSPEGLVRYGAAPGARKVRRFEILDREKYAEAMTSLTAHLISLLGKDRKNR